MSKEILDLCRRANRGRKWILKRIAVYYWPNKPANLEKMSEEKILDACTLDILSGILYFTSRHLDFQLPREERMRKVKEIFKKISEAEVDTEELFELASEVTHDELELSMTCNITAKEILDKCPDEFLDPLLREIHEFYSHKIPRNKCCRSDSQIPIRYVLRRERMTSATALAI